jgi:hypothetical protein
MRPESAGFWYLRTSPAVTKNRSVGMRRSTPYVDPLILRQSVQWHMTWARRRYVPALAFCSLTGMIMVWGPLPDEGSGERRNYLGIGLTIVGNADFAAEAATSRHNSKRFWGTGYD